MKHFYLNRFAAFLLLLLMVSMLLLGGCVNSQIVGFQIDLENNHFVFRGTQVLFVGEELSDRQFRELLSICRDVTVFKRTDAANVKYVYLGEENRFFLPLYQQDFQKVSSFEAENDALVGATLRRKGVEDSYRARAEVSSVFQTELDGCAFLNLERANNRSGVYEINGFGAQKAAAALESYLSANSVACRRMEMEKTALFSYGDTAQYKFIGGLLWLLHLAALFGYLLLFLLQIRPFWDVAYQAGLRRRWSFQKAVGKNGLLFFLSATFFLLFQWCYLKAAGLSACFFATAGIFLPYQLFLYLFTSLVCFLRMRRGTG